jgi:hypothetical protein
VYRFFLINSNTENTQLLSIISLAQMRSSEFVLLEGFPMVAWFFLLCNLLRTTRNAFGHLSAMFFKVSKVIWGVICLNSLKSLLYWFGFSHVSVLKGPWAKPHKALTTSFCNTRTSEVTGIPVFVSWEMRVELLSRDCSLTCIMMELCLPGVFLFNYSCSICHLPSKCVVHTG